MSSSIANGYIKKGNTIVLLVVAVLACVVLTIFNYNTIKVVSGINAYISGESTYSKYQKEGVRHLLTYLTYEDTLQYQLFKEHISVPLYTGDGFRGLLNSSAESFVKNDFVKGQNHPEDVESIIWLYQGFKHYEFMKSAIETWRQGDSLIHALIHLGEDINQKILFQTGGADSLLKHEFFDEINDLSYALTVKETEFSAHMRKVAFNASRVLFWVNAIVITLMLASVVIFSNVLIFKLEKSQRKLESTNAGLIATNDKLDNFIYATSHELKSPINNLQGLLNLLFMYPASNPVQESIRNKMNASIVALTSNINRLEQLMLIHSEPDTDVVEINMRELLFQTLEEHNEFIEAAGVSVVTHFELEKLFYSRSGMNEIILNLLSNSIKYKAPDRPGEITISTYLKDAFFVLRFADNGMGMDAALHGDQIFGLFKRFHKNLSGNGVGLYLVKQIVERNGGFIRVESEIGVGTIFEIFLKKQ